jgi:hypothetical protein
MMSFQQSKGGNPIRAVVRGPKAPSVGPVASLRAALPPSLNAGDL